jgi:hypothetical protein
MKVEHVENWKTMQPVNINDVIEKYRPKEIRRYEENGHIVRVFEPVWVLRS